MGDGSEHRWSPPLTCVVAWPTLQCDTVSLNHPQHKSWMLQYSNVHQMRLGTPLNVSCNYPQSQTAHSKRQVAKRQTPNLWQIDKHPLCINGNRLSQHEGFQR